MNDVEKFVHRLNIKNLRKQLEEVSDDAHREVLLELLAEEEAKAAATEARRQEPE